MGVPHEPVVSPPANVSRPSRTPFSGALGRKCSCLDGNDWKFGITFSSSSELKFWLGLELPQEVAGQT